MRYSLSSFSCALTFGVLFWRINASCYYPDGENPSDYNYAPCSDDANASCCILEEGNQCLSNGLCVSSYTGLYRGGCSDKTWKSDSCFQHCINATDTWSSGSYDDLVSCGGNKYCCSSEGSTCCNDDAKVFDVAAASVIKDLGTSASATLPIQLPTETSSMPDSTNKPSNSNPKTTKTAAAAATTTASPNQETPEPASSSPSKVAVIAGAAAGVVILIIAVLLVFFLVRRRYKKKLAAGTNAQAFPMSSEGFQKLPDDKSPRPVEVPAPMHSPAPPYGPPAYQPLQHGAVEIDNSYLPPGRNQYGQPVYEAPAQPYYVK